MALKTKAKSTKISVNMAGVEVAKLVGEGIHKLKVNEVKKEVADSGKDKLEWKFGVTAGPFKNSTLYYNTSLQPQALWNLKGLLEALGVDVPDGVMDLDLKELVDMEVGGQVEHEVYEGKKRARIVDFMPIDEVTGEGGEEEEVAGEEQEIDEDAIKAMDEEELEELVKANEIDVDLDKHKTIKAKRQAVIDAIEEANAAGGDGDNEGGAEEEDDGKYSEEQIDEMGKDELAAVVKKHKLKVTLEGVTSAQRKQLKKALAKAELMKDE